MEIKDIVLFLRADAPFAAQVAVAARLAKDHGADIEGVCLFVEPALPFPDTYAIGTAATLSVLDDRDREVREMIAPIEAAFRQAMAIHGCGASWSVEGPDEAARLSAQRARLADLAIVRRPEPRDLDARDLAATIASASGTPCLIVPDVAPPEGRFNRVVLAWNGSKNAKRALDDGFAILKQASAVQVVIVGGETTTQMDEPSGEALLRYLARHGVHAELKRLAKRHEDVGKVILGACEAFEADLLVMGAYGHSRAAEAVFGGATRTVLSHAAIPVLMSH